MKSKRPQADIAARIREVVRFDALYSRRLRDIARGVRVNEVNAAELGIFLELLAGPCTPGWLSWRLGLDPGYLSRNLRNMELRGSVSVCGSDYDRRQRQWSLTNQGRRVARSLEWFQEEAVRKTLEDLPLRQQRRLVRAMKVIVEIFERDALTNLLESHDLLHDASIG